ncbi:hypothetical protein BDF19DRAFT_447698 [Syncephalis fuscata]|nr:hypothetical protein BDF19DRAFT_447698 [Syncephalis fuscata]
MVSNRLFKLLMNYLYLIAISKLNHIILFRSCIASAPQPVHAYLAKHIQTRHVQITKRIP